MNSRYKYLVPNLITLTSLSMGVIAIFQTLKGNIHTAAWLGFLSMLLDRFDGMTARKIGASSSFGLEIDSLADVVAFGITPAVILYAVLSMYSPHFRDGIGEYIPLAVGVFWAVASCLRLAKYNIVAQAGEFDDIFQGFPMPIASGLILSPVLFLLKYVPSSGYGFTFYDKRIMGTLEMNSGHWLFTVLAVWAVIIAVGMLSSLKVPKLKPPAIKWQRRYLLIHALTIYFMIVIRAWPEFLFLSGLEFVILSIVFHLKDPEARKCRYIPMLDVMSWKIDTKKSED
ncbi:MAG: CDP-alcohol phosphatidyltransferase family protein [Deltaproteobacteria bacterium]|nr:CDP-alcohol phosphatidyltransferase family protein [Deltaproteobacteria bacterium]